MEFTAGLMADLTKVYGVKENNKDMVYIFKQMESQKLGFGKKVKE